jgi:hypothetical protein
MAGEVKPIRTKRDYQGALKEVERLCGAKAGTRGGDRLDVLATLIDAYEAEHYPMDPPICRLRPSVQPNACRASRNAATRACPSGSSAVSEESTPTRRIWSACWALVPSGHATAAPPSNLMS